MYGVSVRVCVCVCFDAPHDYSDGDAFTNKYTRAHKQYEQQKKN